jgi:hypothetical protein
VARLPDNIIEFKQDDARPVGFLGDLEWGQVSEMLAAPVHQDFRPITDRRPQRFLDTPHAIIGLGHRSLLISRDVDEIWTDQVGSKMPRVSFLGCLRFYPDGPAGSIDISSFRKLRRVCALA